MFNFFVKQKMKYRENRFMEETITHRVTNHKLDADLRWADFRGFSLLFDNPVNSLSEWTDDLAVIDCRDIRDNPALRFYRLLDETLQKTGVFHRQAEYMFRALPPQTYHVTAWDGLNVSNQWQMRQPLRDAIKQFFHQFPQEFLKPNPFTQLIKEHPLIDTTKWHIRFAFDSIQQWNNKSLVVVLKPADEHSAAIFQRWKTERLHLNGMYRRFSVTMSPDFYPHISLGYYANRMLASGVLPEIPDMQRMFAQRLAGETLAFESIALYGFMNMVTFFKAL